MKRMVFGAMALGLVTGVARSEPPLPPVRPPLGTAAPAERPSIDNAGRSDAEVPLPPARPAEFGPQRPKPSLPPATDGPAPTPPAAPSPDAATRPPTWVSSGQTVGSTPDALVPGAFPVDQMDAACTRVLASGTVVGRRGSSIMGPNGCGIAYPLTLQAVLLKDGGQVAFEPPPTVRCDLADALAEWVREDLAPLGGPRGRLLAVQDAAAYVCRGRNNVLGAPMSEHGRGDAIDILGLRFATGPVPLVASDAHELWSAIKLAGCNRFRTVLGPGSDGYHENNLHLDLENRRNGSHYCHWDHP